MKMALTIEESDTTDYVSGKSILSKILGRL